MGGKVTITFDDEFYQEIKKLSKNLGCPMAKIYSKALLNFAEREYLHHESVLKQIEKGGLTSTNKKLLKQMKSAAEHHRDSWEYFFDLSQKETDLNSTILEAKK